MNCQQRAESPTRTWRYTDSASLVDG